MIISDPLDLTGPLLSWKYKIPMTYNARWGWSGDAAQGNFQKILKELNRTQFETHSLNIWNPDSGFLLSFIIDRNQEKHFHIILTLYGKISWSYLSETSNLIVLIIPVRLFQFYVFLEVFYLCDFYRV